MKKLVLGDTFFGIPKQHTHCCLHPSLRYSVDQDCRKTEDDSTDNSCLPESQRRSKRFKVTRLTSVKNLQTNNRLIYAITSNSSQIIVQHMDISAGDIVVSKWEYLAKGFRVAGEADISFAKSEQMRVLDLRPNGWVKVELVNSGKVGLAPIDFLMKSTGNFSTGEDVEAVWDYTPLGMR